MTLLPQIIIIMKKEKFWLVLYIVLTILFLWLSLLMYQKMAYLECVIFIMVSLGTGIGAAEEVEHK